MGSSSKPGITSTFSRCLPRWEQCGRTQWQLRLHQWPRLRIDDKIGFIRAALRQLARIAVANASTLAAVGRIAVVSDAGLVRARSPILGAVLIRPAAGHARQVPTQFRRSTGGEERADLPTRCKEAEGGTTRQGSWETAREHARRRTAAEASGSPERAADVVVGRLHAASRR